MKRGSRYHTPAHIRRAGYRSGIEKVNAEYLMENGVLFEYEKTSIPYTIPASTHTYTPDFVLENGIIVEVKGIFSLKDRQKHLWIQQQHPHLDIRFVFSNPQAKLYKKGKTTYAQWCDAHGFLWAAKMIPATWWKEAKKPLIKGDT